MNNEIGHYAEARQREKDRVADGLRGALRSLGYDLKNVNIGEGQRIINQDGRPARAAVSLWIGADEVTGDPG
jgi:hypothetical protein